MTIDKRAARATWKEREVVWCVYAARVGGQCWVGVTSDLTAARNRLAFSLKMGKAPVAACKPPGTARWRWTSWNGCDPELSELRRGGVAKERRAAWAAELGAAEMER
ncbi:MAG: hypothetical protein R3D85_07425 [Paracoccaceae bacterium]